MTRAEAEQRIEALLDQGVNITGLIRILDQIDGDPDMECTEDDGDFDGEGEYDHMHTFDEPSVVRECKWCGTRHGCV